MTEPLRIGLAGLGTVGAGVVRMLQTHGETIAARAGRPLEIVAVSARSRSRDRGVDLAGYGWEDDPVALARRGDVDLVVEAMGGEDGPAKATAEAALGGGKHLVTANKAMLARHGQALAERAEAAGVALRFEAAVAGGIPVVKALTEGLAGNAIERVMGVLNGTCNYILTRMEAEDAPYARVLEAAQRLGYAEADPAFDVGGIDAAQKLALLAAIAFGTRVDFAAMTVEGIERVSLADIEHAAELGYRIKLLGVARRTPAGLEARMQPCLVPAALADRAARGRHQHGGDRGRLRRADRDERTGRRRGADRLGDRRRRHRYRPRAGDPGLRAACGELSLRRRVPATARPRPITCAFWSPTRPGCSRKLPRRWARPGSRSTGCARSSTKPPMRRS